MIYNLSLLMSRRSVRVRCVFVHMFLYVCVFASGCGGGGVYVCSRILHVSASSVISNTVSSEKKSLASFFDITFPICTLLPVVLRWSWQRCYHGFCRYHGDRGR